MATIKWFRSSDENQLIRSKENGPKLDEIVVVIVDHFSWAGYEVSYKDERWW